MSGPACANGDCPHVAATGSHFFPWIDASFDHEFGTQRVTGHGRCDCGAEPDDHGAYDIRDTYGDYTPDDSDTGDVYLSRSGLY